ncbi:MAG: hypothetical protein O2983_11595 [Planctomycetota bacterium]|nr:hypothetical protein [Planctomycetota bacterium]MDA1160245.1 hypothetical protein [Planctomycetota bacterium]
MKKHLLTTVALLTALAVSSVGNAANLWQLKSGTPDLKSAGNLTFGPDGIIFVGDSKGAAVFAIDTGDTKDKAAGVSLNVASVGAELAKALNVSAKDVTVNDLAVNPSTGQAFLAVTKGSGSDATPAIVRVDAKGAFSEVSLNKVAFSKVELPNVPEDKAIKSSRGTRNSRDDAITDLAYVDGRVIVSGLTAGSEGRTGSTVREIAFPFAAADQGSRIEIYHGAHGRTEDGSAIRTFVPFNINGEPTLLAGYVCTPLVKFPLSSLKAGEKTVGTTVAELGNRNRPLDMIVYEKDGKDFLLLANSARGVMKISTEDIATNKGISSRVADKAGQPYDTIASLQGVVQLDKLNETTVVVLIQAENGAMQLKTVELP